MALAAVVILAVLAGRMVWQARPQDDHVIRSGGVIVGVEGHPYWKFPWTVRITAGVGYGGTVGLTDDGCIVMTGLGRGVAAETFIVWPSGTTVRGRGADIEIRVGRSGSTSVTRPKVEATCAMSSRPGWRPPESMRPPPQGRLRAGHLIRPQGAKRPLMPN